MKTKLETAIRLRELAADVMKPWMEIHGMVLDVDGSHNRILGLGIKDASVRAHKAILSAARRYEVAHDLETKAVYISVGGDGSEAVGGEEEGE